MTIADAILDSQLSTPLKGIAIGNGWIDGYTQYPSYLEYAVKHGILSESEDVSLRSYHIDAHLELSNTICIGIQTGEERDGGVYEQACGVYGS